MGYGSNQNLLWICYLVESVRKTLYEAAPCQPADLGPRLRHELYSLNCRFHFLEKTEAQTRQLVIVKPYSLIQFNIGWGEKSGFQR
jgi:hypothetical protein